MQAQVRIQRDGTILLRMDQEAAHATFASVIFAAQYHEGIRGMEEVARRALTEETKPGSRRNTTCR